MGKSTTAKSEIRVYCYLGAFQFLPSIRRHSLKWHRYNGRLMVVSGIVSALSGLWMTHFYSFPYVLQGDLLYCVRMVLGSAMVVFVFLGLAAILKRDIVRHSSWMIRAYAIGQGASTQGLIIMSCNVTTGYRTASRSHHRSVNDLLLGDNPFRRRPWFVRKVFKKMDGKSLNTDPACVGVFDLRVGRRPSPCCRRAPLVAETAYNPAGSRFLSPGGSWRSPPGVRLGPYDHRPDRRGRDGGGVSGDGTPRRSRTLRH